MSPELLKEQWHKRVFDAKLRLDFARNYLEEISQDLKSGGIPAADGNFAQRRAIAAERTALAGYVQVLRIYHDLLAHGKIPDESKAQSAGESD